MATWRIWFWSIFAVLVIGAFALFFAVWNNLSSAWTVEQSAAQYALDHSAIDKIESHDVFTSGHVEEVFKGTDAFGQQWVTFVYGSPFVAQSIKFSNLVTETSVLAASSKEHIKVKEVHLGYLDEQQRQKLNADAQVVYEVVGNDPTGHTTFAYFDATNGKLAWKYVLST